MSFSAYNIGLGISGVQAVLPDSLQDGCLLLNSNFTAIKNQLGSVGALTGLVTVSGLVVQHNINVSGKFYGDNGNIATDGAGSLGALNLTASGNLTCIHGQTSLDGGMIVTDSFGKMIFTGNTTEPGIQMVGNFSATCLQTPAGAAVSFDGALVETTGQGGLVFTPLQTPDVPTLIKMDLQTNVCTGTSGPLFLIDADGTEMSGMSSFIQIDYTGGTATMLNLPGLTYSSDGNFYVSQAASAASFVANTEVQTPLLNVTGGPTSITFSSVPQVTQIALDNQTGTLGTTNLVSSGPGLYILSYYLETAINNAGAGTVTVNFNWTDNAGTPSNSSVALSLASRGRTTGVFPVNISGSNALTYSTTVSSNAGGAAKYSLHAGTLKLI